MKIQRYDPLIYFTRHGLIAGEDKITNEGRIALQLIRCRMEARGWRPVTALTSPAQRCVETAYLLAPALKNKVGISLRPDIKLEFTTTIELSRFRRDATVQWIVSEMPRHGDLIVVGHDSFPAALALCLVERRGGTVDWENIPHHLRLLQRGHGVLVCGKNYEYIAP